ncbi:hypothetical protein HRI_004225500 [Hibiscus trionum]|uniref:Reverse transcriptase n=1 Tax=Hibiscus trionum TaxID=183268 RepID=A0A9W7J368_HIBTR|nr:hypothetical protein HRI_004225500 [Hibiscus trionum]
MKGFRNALADCSLEDLGYTGCWFTWEKGRMASTTIRERLDRGVASDLWLSMFPGYKLEHLVRSFSDHCPLLLTTSGSNGGRLPQKFRFEAAWMFEVNFEETVRQFWHSSNVSLPNKLSLLAARLSDWHGKLSRSKKEYLRSMHKKLEQLYEEPVSDEVLGEILGIKADINLETDKEELYWEQRARINWLQNGDRNTPFFHRHASIRRSTNIVEKLIDDVGTSVFGDSDMLELASSYFASLFTSQGSNNVSEVLDNIEQVISADMNEELMKPFSKHDVWEALKSMSPLKACGDDGFGALFFQKLWHIVGDEVSNFCISLIRGEGSLSEINSTTIVLVPKVSKPNRMNQFRPISLCNIIYKIIAKMLVICFQGVLPLCIDEAQSAFVPGRLISDNILTAYEVLHAFKNKRRGKRGFFALKLDMSKAYDKFEWGFLSTVLQRMGFTMDWVEILMRCVSTVSYTVTMNGMSGETFFPSRGLRQGDPLSPYLFLICSEGLSALIRSKLRRGQLRGAVIARNAPPITHLLFADDCLLFGDATAAGASILRDILITYSHASGQLINFDKSGVFFSSNVIEENRSDVCRILNVNSSTNMERYFGLPPIIGRNKKAAFEDLFGKVLKRSNLLSARLLSAGGKEVFIKSVLQAIPIYTMSCFLLPSTFCKKLEGVLGRFWWRNSSSKRGIHWCTWNSLCVSKDDGGMGFRDLSNFNVALLAKQGWRLITNPESLLARTLRARYFPRDDFLSARLGSNPSYTWRSIWASRALLEKGLCWRVGNGSNISIWNSFWLPVSPPRLVQTPPSPGLNWVSDLMLLNPRRWNDDLIYEVFSQSEAHIILSIPLPSTNLSDILVWGVDPKGVYSVRSGYYTLQNQSNQVGYNDNSQSIYKQIWSLLCPAKIKIMGWRLLKNYIPTMHNLYHKRIAHSPICPKCLLAPESIEHFARDCVFAKEVWNLANFTWPLSLNSESFFDWFCWVFTNNSGAKRIEFLIILWSIWYVRNKLVHEGINQKPIEVITFARSYLRDLERASFVSSVAPVASSAQWTPPSDPVVKVNVDTAFNSDSSLAVSGVVVRDSEGLVLGSCIRLRDGLTTAFAAEAQAVIDGLKFVSDLGCMQVLLESDSRSVIGRINSSGEDLFVLRPFIEDAKRLSEVFDSCRFVFSGRESNSAAHSLARLGRQYAGDTYWIEEVPSPISNIIRADRSHLSPI